MSFYLISWKEFSNNKMLPKASIVNVEDSKVAILNMKKVNADKRLTTTDYDTFNLTELLAEQKFSILPVEEEAAPAEDSNETGKSI